MGRLIFKQPNGLYGRWSGIVDAFTWWNFTKQNVKTWMQNNHNYIISENDFKDYDRYNLDYIIENHGFMLCYRAYREGNINADVFQALRDMGASEEQTDGLSGENYLKLLLKNKIKEK